MDERFHLFRSKHIISILKILFAVVFIVFIFYEGRKELASIKANDIESILKSLPSYILIIFTLGGMLAVCTSFIHDLIISKELSIKIAKNKILRIGLIASTLNNISGGLFSASTRGILYGKEGINAKESTYYNILIVTSFSTGLSALTLIVLLNFNTIRPIFERYTFALAAVLIILFYSPLFFMINKVKWLKKKLLGDNADRTISDNLLKKLFLSSVFEWTAAAMFFSLIALYFSSNVNFIDLFSVFIIASVIGVVSLIPGAIGAFDITIILGMSLIKVEPHNAVVTLIIFRLFYYIVPLIIALLISTPLFLKRRVK